MLILFLPHLFYFGSACLVIFIQSLAISLVLFELGSVECREFANIISIRILSEAKRSEWTNAHALKQYLPEYKLIMCVHRFYVPRLWLNNCLKEIFRFSPSYIRTEWTGCYNILLRFFFYFILFRCFNIQQYCSFLMMKAHTHTLFLALYARLCGYVTCSCTHGALMPILWVLERRQTFNHSTKNGYGNENKSNRLR